MFRDIKEPTINELVHFFQVEFPALATSMKESNHNSVADEPNPFHIEDTVWAHTMMVCLRAENDNSNKIVNICALLHDIGKPEARDVIPFEAKKPVHSESNELRNDGKDDGKPSGLNRVVPKSGLKSHFRGHEGLSFYRAIEVVNKLKDLGVLTYDEKKQILTIISLHGTLFDSIDAEGEMRKPFRVFDRFQKNEAGLQLFQDYVSQVKNDSTGRFFTSKDGRKSNAYRLGKEIFSAGQFGSYCMEKGYPNDLPVLDDSNPWITVLVGVPACGKSTWREENLDEDDVVISRDDIMLQYAKEIGFEGNYSETWKYLEDNDLHKAVDALERDKYNKAVQDRKYIIIDRTNMSRKSRRKWISQIKNYNKRAVVFATDYNEIYSRNKKRFEETGKNISPKIIGSMMRQFMVPTYDEVDLIEWVF